MTNKQSQLDIQGPHVSWKAIVYKDNQRPWGRLELYLMRLPQGSGDAHPTFGMSILSTHHLGPPEEKHLSFGFLSRMRAKSPQFCLTLCDPMDCSQPGSTVHGDSPGKNSGVGCRFLLQGIFPTLESNLCLLHWQADSLPLAPTWVSPFPVCHVEGVKLSAVPLVTDVPSFSELLLGSTLWGSQPLTLGNFWVLLSLPLVLVISQQEAGRLGNGYGAARSTQKRLLPLGRWVGSLAPWSSTVNLPQQKMKEVNSLLRIPRDCEGN